jgi:hypothetical protein
VDVWVVEEGTEKTDVTEEGLGEGCEGGRGRTGGAPLAKVPLFWWYVPCRALYRMMWAERS